MLGIKINNEFLDLLPGSSLDFEQNNPYLQFDANIVGEYSLPLEVIANAKNMRLLKYAGLIQTKVDNKGIDASAYHEGFQHSTGRLKIERPTINLNNAKRGRISIYYLMGISSFYQDAKNQRLKSINAGGVRSFANDNFNILSTGFWSHIHKVIAAPAGYGASGYDYAFYPVVNEDFGGNAGTDVLNYMQWGTAVGRPLFTRLTTDNRWCNLIVPFPYLKYVLLKAVELTGWTIEGDILNDPQFCKATMINSFCINWGWHAGTSTQIHSTVKFNLVDNLPDISVPELLIALKNRFGWWYDFNTKQRKITVNSLIRVAQSNIKDFSAYANPVLVKKVNQEKKVFALKEGNANEISFAGVDYKGMLTKRSALPSPSETLYNQVYLIADENNYYICQLNDAGAWSWEFWASGNGSYVPSDATEDIATETYLPDITNFNSYLDFVPMWNESGYWPGLAGEDDYAAQIVLAFYYGLAQNKGNLAYPLGSPHIYDSKDNEVGSWSLAFKAKKLDGSEVGIYDLNWKKFLDTLNAYEEFEVTLNLPLVEFLKLDFSNIISINNVRMYVTKIKSTLPYSGSVNIEASRI
jgi:hypothetical protein